MDTKSKILSVVFSLLVIGSVGIAYYRYMVVHDYIVEVEVDCDPTFEACFIYVCDPEGEECSGDPEEDTWYYKVFRRNVANIPVCDPSEESCEAYICAEGERDCEEIFCDESTLVEFDAGDACSDPEEYLLEHPEDVAETEEEIGEETVSEAEEEMTAEEDESGNPATGESADIPTDVVDGPMTDSLTAQEQ